MLPFVLFAVLVVKCCRQNERREFASTFTAILALMLALDPSSRATAQPAPLPVLQSVQLRSFRWADSSVKDAVRPDGTVCRRGKLFTLVTADEPHYQYDSSFEIHSKLPKVKELVVSDAQRPDLLRQWVHLDFGTELSGRSFIAYAESADRFFAYNQSDGFANIYTFKIKLSPDGSYLLDRDSTGIITLAPPAPAEPRRESGFSSLAVSPKGDLLWVGCGSQDPDRILEFAVDSTLYKRIYYRKPVEARLQKEIPLSADFRQNHRLLALDGLCWSISGLYLLTHGNNTNSIWLLPFDGQPMRAYLPEFAPRATPRGIADSPESLYILFNDGSEIPNPRIAAIPKLSLN